MKRILLILALLIPTASLAQAPKCLFTDVTSGPASGGEGGNGIYITITAYNVGTSRGTSTVTVNGTAVAQYITWGAGAVSDSTGTRQTIGVQVASGTTGTGNVVVTTSGGSCGTSTGNGSFPLPFTVRTAPIYFIGSATDNSAMPSCATAEAANSYTAPWGMSSTATGRTPYAYYECAMANTGGVLVFLNGANYALQTDNTWHTTIKMDQNGTSSAPLTIMARPGATATLGSGASTPWYALRVSGSGANYTTVSGMTLIGASGNNGSAFALGTYNRLVGNTLSCPTCGGEAGAIDGSSGGGAGSTILGNLVTNTSYPGPSNKQYHDIYMSGNNWEFGWNKIAASGGYNGLQVNEDGQTGWYNFSIHDNDISTANGAGVNLSTVNPGGGYVEVYNNVIHQVGIKRASDGGSGDFHSAISFPYYQSGTPSGTAAIYNNTIYDASSILSTSSSGESDSGCFTDQATSGSMTINLINNACVQPGYTYTANYNVYFGSSVSATLSGSKNLFYSGATPASTTPAASLTSLTVPTNPGFTSLADGSWTNYIPTVSSPLIAAGAVLPTNIHALGQSLPLTWDFQGLAVNPSAPQIGALAFSSGTTFTLTCATAGTGSGGITGSACNALYSPGGSYSFTANPAAGSTFASWTSSPSCGGTASGNVYSGTMPAANCTITATFNLTTTFTLTATTSGTGTGTVTGATCAGTRATGASFSCSATAGTGSSFGVWTSSCAGTASGTTYSGSMPAANCSVNGSFTLNSYALTTATAGSGTGTVTGCAGSLLYGAAYTCTANPAAGSVFVSWASTCGGTATSNTYHGTMPAAACSVTATFSTTPTYTLSTATAGTGSGTVSGCAGSLIAGAAYSCSAAASTGSAFTSWASTCGGTPSGTTYAGSMPASNCSVTATFTLNTFTLSCSMAGSGSGTISGSTCNSTYGYGSSYSFTATASGGSTFVNWASSPSCGGTASGAVYSGNMPNAACTLTPTFNLTTPGKGVIGGKGVVGGKGTVGP